MKYCEGIPKKKRKKKRFEKKKKSATFAVTMTLNFFPPKLMVVRFMRRVCDDGRTTPHPSLPSYAYNSRTILAIFFIALLFIDPPFPLPCVNSPTAALGYFDVSSAPRPVVESRRRRSATYGVEAPFHSRRFHRVGWGGWRAATSAFVADVPQRRGRRLLGAGDAGSRETRMCGAGASLLRAAAAAAAVARN